MPSLPDELQKHCRAVLLQCNEFSSHASLCAVFVTTELRPFLDGLLEAASKSERVDVCMAYLLERRLSDGRPVLPLFLAALCDRYKSGDALRDELGALTEDTRDALGLSATTASIRIRYPRIPSLPQPYFAHPYPLQANFTGRDTERDMLSDWLKNDDRPVVALVAIGGMGKSALTWYWLQHDVASGSLDGIVWWSFYEGESSLSSFLAEALVYTSGHTVDPASIPSDYDKTQQLFNLLQQRHILIVLDGFERALRAYASMGAVYQSDATVDEVVDARACVEPNSARLLRNLVAGPTQAKVVITTRLMIKELEDQTGTELAGCRKEELGSLSPSDAYTFMRAQGVDRGSRAEIDSACASYGYHPLSLRLLSGLIARDKRNPGDITTAPRHDVHDSLIARQHHVLEEAYNALPDEVRTLLSRMAAFRSPMDYDALSVFNAFHSEAPFDEALDELIERGLVFRDKARNRYDLHPVVRSYAYDRLMDPVGTHTRLRDYFQSIAPPSDNQVHSVDDIVPVIELYHHSVRAGFLKPAAQLFRSRLTRVLYFELAAYAKFAELGAEFLEAAEAGTCADELDILSITNRVGDSHQRMGLLCQALDERRRVNRAALEYPQSDLSYRTCSDIAQIERDLGELQRAENHFNQAIRSAEDHQSPREIGRTLQEYALLLSAMGSHELAIPQLERAGGVQYSRQHNRAVAYLALVHLRLGSLPEAAKALDQAKKLAEGFGRNQVWVQWLRGKAALARDELAESDACLAGALTTCRRIDLAELEPDILLDLARLRMRQAETSTDRSSISTIFDEARNYADEALSIADRCEYRLKQADIHNYLGQWELRVGNLPEACRNAQIARERAWCDGPPYCYKPALDEAERLLREVARHS